MGILANLLQAHGSLGEAVTLARESLGGLRSAHPHTRFAHRLLLGLFTAQGKHRKAHTLSSK